VNRLLGKRGDNRRCTSNPSYVTIVHLSVSNLKPRHEPNGIGTTNNKHHYYKHHYFNVLENENKKNTATMQCGTRTAKSYPCVFDKITKAIGLMYARHYRE